ncbi:PQ-loop domain-containing transporter [Mycoplasma buteonis]|uniref:PQ-loop domain-containing transporter n=1 Tax=Mycoplasma buteonis TaxID=171280 RepID=UPI000689AB49|nr:PQ-loop domain-containing transporter [Mycoplasma buteonis]
MLTANITRLFEASENGASKSSVYDLPITIFLVLTSILIVCLSLPQLYKSIKDKKTGEISFLSFWIFHLGILGWVIYGTTNMHSLYNVVIADGLSVFVNGVMTYLLYRYKEEFTFKKKMQGLIGVLVTWVINIVLIALFIHDELSAADAKLIQLSDNYSAIMGYIFPALTTLAFTPQLIKSFKTKKWQGVSIWMFVIYEVNNIVWIIWWILEILRAVDLNLQYQSLLAGLIWQIISLTIFGVQLGFTLYDKHLIKTGKKIA